MALWQRQEAYRLHDSINDLSCGITEQIVGLFLKGLLFLGYLGTYGYATRAGINLVDVSSYSAGGKWLAAILLFLGVDCAYYWFHRIAHEYNAPLGRARRAPFERRLQPGGGPAAGDVSGALFLGLLPAAGAGGLSACLVRGGLQLRHALPVLDSHPLDRQAGPAGMGVQHAVASSRAPRP